MYLNKIEMKKVLFDSAYEEVKSLTNMTLNVRKKSLYKNCGFVIHIRSNLTAVKLFFDSFLLNMSDIIYRNLS